MAARVVRRAGNVVMVGADHHGGLYYHNIFTGLGTIPGPPVPHPPSIWPMPPHSFHFVFTTSAAPNGDHEINTTVIVEGDPIVSKGHEAKHSVHIPPGGNILWPVTMYFASSKWILGVASVQATKGPVASTSYGAFGSNYNCQDPCSLPLPNVMIATASVQVGPTDADRDAAALEMAMQSAIEVAISFGLEFGPHVAKYIYGKLSSSRAVSNFFRSIGTGLRGAGKTPIFKKFAGGGVKRLAKPGLKKVSGIAISFAKGSSGDLVKDNANKLSESKRSEWLNDATGDEPEKTRH